MAEANFIVRARDRTREALAGVDGRLAKLQGRMRSFGMGGMGAALGAGAMVAYGKAALSTSDNIDNLAKRMRLGNESVQSMGVLMREAGMSVEMLQSPLDRLKQQMDEARVGNAAAAKSFADIGITMEDLEKMSPEQALEAVARALHRNAGDARTGAAATDLLGARSTRLNHVLQQLGAQGFGGLNAHMLKTKQIMEGDLVKAGDRMEESLSRAMNRMTVSRNEVITKTMAGMVQFGGGLKGLFTERGKTAGEAFMAGAMRTTRDLFEDKVKIPNSVTEEIEAPIVEAGTKAAEAIKRSFEEFDAASLNQRAQSRQIQTAEKQRETLITQQRLTITAIQALSISPLGA